MISLSNRIDLANGLNLSATAGFRTLRPLSNHSDYSLFYRDIRNYTPNLPQINNMQQQDETSPEEDPSGSDGLIPHVPFNEYHEEAFFDVRLEYTPKYYYRINNGRKHYLHSAFPTIYLHNRMAVPGVFNSSISFGWRI
jgi:hypothetical protein